MTTMNHRHRAVYSSTTRRGTAATELAILLPLLAFFFSAVFDTARVFSTLQVLDSAAYAAASYACGTSMTTGSSQAIIATAQQVACSDAASLSPALQSSNVGVSTSGGYTSVVIDYDMPLMTAVLMPTATVHLQRSISLPVAVQPGY